MICMSDELPTYESIQLMLKDINVPFDPRIPNLPSFSLPSVPTPMYANLSIPEFQKASLITEMMTAQFMNWIKAAFDPIIGFLGIAFEFPKIPYLNISLPDLLNPDFNIASLIPRLPEFALPTFDMSSLIPSVPTLPDPLLPNMKIPELELVAKVQALIQAYSGTLLTSLTALISQVVDKLGRRPFNFGIDMPAIPTMPTDFGSLMAPVLALYGVPTVEALLTKIKTPGLALLSIEAMMSGMSIPGFPDLNLAVPSPLFGSFNNPQLAIMQMSRNLYASMSNAALAIVKRFCDAIKNFIDFSFPKICIPVPSIVY